MNDLGYPEACQLDSWTKALFVLFSSFFLENESLIAVADWLYDSFDISVSDKWPAQNCVCFGSSEQDFIEFNLFLFQLNTFLLISWSSFVSKISTQSSVTLYWNPLALMTQKISFLTGGYSIPTALLWTTSFYYYSLGTYMK